MVEVGRHVGEVGDILGSVPSEEFQEIEVGGKVRATIEELQQLSRYNGTGTQFEQAGVRHFIDISFFSNR